MGLLLIEDLLGVFIGTPRRGNEGTNFRAGVVIEVVEVVLGVVELGFEWLEL